MKKLKLGNSRLNLLVLCFATACLFSANAQTTWYVSPDGPGEGTAGWADATNSLPGAISKAAGGDTVLVSNGVYVSTGMMGNRSMLNITKAIVVKSIAGKEETVLDGNAPAKENTVVFLGHPDAVLDGFTVKGGLAVSGSQSERRGGGIKISGGGTVKNCLITENSAGRHDSFGGAGGGIHVVAGSAALIENCIVSHNVTDIDTEGGSAGGNGGGIHIDGSEDGEHAVLVKNCRIINNLTGGIGGGIWAKRGLILTCLISGNSAPSTEQNKGLAGGLYLTETAEARNCVVSANYAYLHASAARLHNGGILRNSLIKNNGSAAGAAIYIEKDAEVQNCTVVCNITTNGVAGGMQVTGGGGEILLDNNIIWLNDTLSYASSNYSRGSGNVIAKNNCVGSTATDFDYGNPALGNISADPLFVDDAGDYALQALSPCVNAGNLAVSAWMFTGTDMKGHRRLDKVSALVDMGCYEYVPVITIFQIR